VNGGAASVLQSPSLMTLPRIASLGLIAFSLAAGCAVGDVDEQDRASAFDLETDDGLSCAEVHSATMTDRETHCPVQTEDNAGEVAVETGLGTLSATYQAIDGYAVVEGDIIVDELDAIHALGGQAAGRSGAARLWPKGVVPYSISASLPKQARVHDAIAQWQKATGLRFVKRTTESSYITFRVGSGCSSMVGRMGGQQFINLASGCGTGAVIHEIGHAVGLWHEQGRPDRDDHVRIRYENIIAGRESQFRKIASTSYLHLGAYDINSVMHYGPNGFSKNGKPTITLKDGSTFRANRAALSEKDRSGIAKMYASQLGTPPAEPAAVDTTTPMLTIVRPTSASLEEKSTIEVVARADDDKAVTSVELLWKTLGTTMACPGTGGAWSCTKSGETYTWKIRVGTGERVFSVRARDAAGNRSETAERTVKLQ
jgi:hypothetical protein